jgi:hypothetical protein
MVRTVVGTGRTAQVASSRPPVAPAPVPGVDGGEPAARQRARDLTLREKRAQAAVRGALAGVQVAAWRSQEVLRGYAQATEAARRAQVTAEDSLAALDVARSGAAAARMRMGRWAAAAYREGILAATADPTTRVFLEGSSPENATSLVVAMQAAGRARDVDLGRAEAGVRAVGRAEVRARAAEVAARQAVDRADDERRRAVAAEDQQRRLLEHWEDAAAEAGRRAAGARARIELLDKAAMRVRQGAGGMGPVGAACAGGDLTGYGNGLLPVSSLCQVWGARAGVLLRADAAAALERVSRAYASRFGRPLCVSDAYRPLAVQVELRRVKPGLAAVPGHSQHGWGVAVDLCGGVERFGTAEHEWLGLRAGAFGWFHPAWARAEGAKPEAWHWEFVAL